MIYAAISPKIMLFIFIAVSLILILFIVLIRYFKILSYKSQISKFMSVVLAGSLLEDEYAAHVFKIEQGKRTIEEIKADFRQKVKQNNKSVRRVDFPKDKIYSDLKKLRKKL